ncbi:MAG: Do family serine endopeptidase [Alphaproteobacteria bacterium]|nr:Do family serine endopeptidase [Alphaproteobacteria bacterium]
MGASMKSSRLVLAVLAVACGPGLAFGAAPFVPQTGAELRATFAPTVKASAPSVVNVYARHTVVTSFRSPFADDPFFGRLFGDGMFGMPRERVENSLGSGVVVREDGVVVTNNHVIQGAEELKVVLADRREFDAKLVLADERTDLAVLRIDPGKEKLPALAFADSDALEVGDVVLAIGNPFGVGQTVTSGIVSALARTQVGVADYRFFIQTDAAINPGNSGGALVTADGHLVGINSAIYSRSGGSNGIGFAIPANMVRLVVDSALSNGRIVRPWLGAETQGVSADIAASLGLARPEGVLVKEVTPESPAAKAGIRTGDLILSVNGFDVQDPEALRYRLAVMKTGGAVPVVFRHGGEIRTVDLALEAPPEVPPRNETKLDGREPLNGATIANLSPALAEELGIPQGQKGVIVTKIAADAFAARTVAPGDILVSINGEDIESVADAKAAVAKETRYWDIVISRGGQLSRFQVRL